MRLLPFYHFRYSIPTESRCSRCLRTLIRRCPMSTTTTLPDWMQDSPACEYWLVGYAPSGDADQEARITLQEYDSLKQRLAKLRGLIPDEEPTAESVQAENTTAKADSPKPQTKTAEMAVNAIDTCIGVLEGKRNVML